MNDLPCGYWAALIVTIVYALVTAGSAVLRRAARVLNQKRRH